MSRYPHDIQQFLPDHIDYHLIIYSHQILVLRASLTRTCHDPQPRLFPKRSPPWLFTRAALGGLKPAPVSRLRGAFPHSLRSSAHPQMNLCPSARSWRTLRLESIQSSNVLSRINSCPMTEFATLRFSLTLAEFFPLIFTV
jgi:hypothetical protein